MRWLFLRRLVFLLVFFLLACHYAPSSSSTTPRDPSPDRFLGFLGRDRVAMEDFYVWAVDRLVDRFYEELPNIAKRNPERFLNKRIPFTTALINGRLAVFDVTTQDIWVYPGAGVNVRRIGGIATESFVCMRGFDPIVYDHEHEEAIQLFEPRSVGGFVLVAFPDAFSNVYCLAADSLEDALQDRGRIFVLKSSRPSLFPRVLNRLSASSAIDVASPSADSTGSATPSAVSAFELGMFPWDPMPKPRSLVMVNALAEQHGLIQTFRVTFRGDVLLFTTRDGGLYLYTPFEPAVQEIRTNRDYGEGRAAFPTLDALTGRLIAWEDFELKQLFVLDRLTGRLEPIPTAPFLDGEPLENIAALVPSFIGIDPFHLYVAVIRTNGRFREFEYNLVTGQVRSLTVINAFLDQQPIPLATGTVTEFDALAGSAF